MKTTLQQKENAATVLFFSAVALVVVCAILVIKFANVINLM